MITATISGAQLDTIDVDHIRELVTLERTVAGMERLAGAMQRTGLAIAAHSASVRALFVAAVQMMGHPATEIDLGAPPRERLELTLPAPIDCAVFPREPRPRSNPSAPIPDRLRRRMDRRRRG